MVKWIKAGDLGLFQPKEEQKPGWMLELLNQRVMTYPIQISQDFYDREINEIMRSGVGTQVLIMRMESRSWISSLMSKEQRDEFRRQLFEKQKGLCWWCKEPMTLKILGKSPTGRFASFEHLVPRSHGGRFTEDNIVLAHNTCNHHRTSKNHLPRYDHDPMKQWPQSTSQPSK